jgi:pseudouridine-5'-phosphate glycosidase
VRARTSRTSVVRQDEPVQVHDEVRDALAEGRGVVALESTIISHGLPRPDNARLAREFEQAVRDGGAVPATVAVVDGEARVGLDDKALDRLANDEEAVKVSVRELAAVAARGGVGSTTVASTAHLAALAGITVFATGGLGGVHRGAQDTFDESADLTALSRTGVLVVCAGVKSILDVGATLERLETLGIGVLGYRTDRFPGFYLADSGHEVGWRVESAHEVAAILAAREGVGTTDLGLVLANPIASEDELDRDLHDRLLASGLAAAERDGVHGKDVTPYLLDWFHRESSGESLRANVALVRSNARLAAEVATAYAGMTPGFAS